MSSTLQYKVLFFFCLVALSPVAAQTVSCWDDLTKQTGYRAHVKKSAVAASDMWEAYVETVARPVKLASGDCANTSRLFVRAKNGAFRVVYITRPTPYMLGNDVEIVGWRGHSLLLNDRAWQYESDTDSNQIVIYRADTETLETPEIGNAITQQLKLKCELRTAAKGWEGDKIRVEVWEAEVDGEGEGCLAGNGTSWLYDVRTNAVMRPSKS